ncbi:MAG TPA: Uma2 family endonuclease [Stellaceae bacterium]|nr:Uma2 family endonuclease [Stellaceae bacterium]
MSEAAFGHMTVEEFLLWEDGTDTRYELIDGLPVAMAPPARAHGMLSARLGGAIDAALRPRRPCAVHTEAGLGQSQRNDTCWIADLAVTCDPHRLGGQLVERPILIVEILSPGTERHDRHTKLPAYRQIASVEEILLIDSQEAYAEILRKSGDNWITELVQGLGASLRLASVDLEIAMAQLYDGIEIAEAG